MVEGSEHELTLERDAGGASRRPRALWGAVAALAVLAGTLAVVAAGGGGDDDPPALPVGLGAATGGAERTAAGDLAMAAWVTYVAGDSLPELGGEAAAYELVGDADRERVADLAAVLGLSGEPEVGPDGWWRVETADGVLEVDGRALGGAWWYSTSVPGTIEPGSSGSSSGGGTAGCEPGPATDCVVTGDPGVAAEECTITEGPDGTTAERCVSEPIPAVDLPSEGEARRIALDLLAAIGIDVDSARVTVDGPYDAWYVSVEPLVDGVTAAGWTSGVGVGPDGTVVHASGPLADAERLGDYPLIDTRAAIDRLNAASIAVADDAPMPLPAPAPMPLPAPETTMLERSGSEAARCELGAPDCADTPTTSIGCKVQPDGREICEVPGTAPFDRGECVTTAAGDDPSATTIPPPEALACAMPACEIDPETAEVVSGPVPDCIQSPMPVEPMPEPEPVEVVLTGAERVLVLMPAVDGSDRTYLVPGYRFSSDDGQVLDVPAVTDELLTSPSPQTPGVTAAPVPPEAEPPEPACEVLVEDDGSGTTHTVVPPGCGEIESSDPEVVHLDDGATPELGVPYYVDVDVECAAFELGGEIWRLVDGDLSGWSVPHEGGRFTLDSETTGTFVGDAFGTKTASFVADLAGDGCTPTPRP